MNPHPVLQLLGQSEEPPFRFVQAAANALAQRPQHLSELLQEDLKDELVGLLGANAGRLCKILWTLSHRTTNQERYSQEVSTLFLGLIEPAFQVLGYSEFQNLTCTALQLCRTKHDRRRVLGGLCACGQGKFLVLLTASEEGHRILQEWLLTSNEEDVDGNTLQVWTRSLAEVMMSCPLQHHPLAALECWRTIESLNEALQAAINDNIRLLGKAKNAKPVFDVERVKLFSELNLKIPGSSRMCRNVLDELCGSKTLAVLKSMVKSYPCRICYTFVESGSALPVFDADVTGYNNPSTHFDGSRLFSGEDIGVWRIVLSSKAYRDLRHYEAEPKIMRSLHAKFADSAAGDIKATLVQPKSGAPRIPLYLTKWRSGTSFLWQVDLGLGSRPDMQQQVIKIWTLGNTESIQSILDEVKRYQMSLAEAYVARCLENNTVLQGRRLPKVYDQLGNTLAPPDKTNIDVRIVDQAFIDTFNKSFTVTSDMLCSIIEQDVKAEYPFDLSPAEMEIIHHVRTPTLILGRSGTGKTTCQVLKMIAKYLASYSISPQAPARQVLLTRSPNLADKISTYSARLLSTLSQKGIAPRKPSKGETLSLLDLGRDDFPLVCTYEQFLILLGHAIETLDWTTSQQTETRYTESALVDFKAFKSNFWPRFPHNLTKGLSPDLVFSEIMGVIKGSIHSCRSLTSLDLSQYKDLSFRLTPNVSRLEHRLQIFELYQAYEELKRKTGNIDSIDLVVRLLRQLHDNPSFIALLAPYIQEVYIDEVQDQRCLDISLFLTLVQSPLEIHLGGDTAQAIAQDSVFRFQDVKALFHDRFFRKGISVTQ